MNGGDDLVLFEETALESYKPSDVICGVNMQGLVSLATFRPVPRASEPVPADRVDAVSRGSIAKKTKS
jgi:hypothetical protein